MLRCVGLVFALSMVPAVCGAQSFELKGYRLGAPMTECPPGASRQQQVSGKQVMCGLGPTTLANQPASDHVVIFADGVTTGVMFQLEQRGRYAGSEVKEALVEKYGPYSSRSKPHLNEYLWERGTEIISLDGYKGIVLLMDLAVNRRLRDEQGKNNKGDL